MAVLRGIDSQHEQDPRLLLRDTRTLGQRVIDFFNSPVNMAATMITLAIMCFVFPALSDFIGVLGIIGFCYKAKHRSVLPFRLPRTANALDYNDLKPGGKDSPNKSRGICFFGNDLNNNEELWFTNEDMRTHVLIFGSTGSGKTEFLLSLAYNALIQGSGFIYVDGKGDNSLFSKVFAMARRMGREDDVLTINFMTGARDIMGPQEKRLSNTLNPFAIGSSSMLSQLVVSLMDSSSATPDGDMWKGRAISFVEALMRLLAYMRDEGHVLLDAHTIRRYFGLEKLEEMVIDKKFPRDGLESIPLDNVPDTAFQPIVYYCQSLPGFSFDPAKKGKQSNQCNEQHGFITMQLTRAFTSLADTYGHILRTNLAEVDLRDVVLNRRILAVLLPALEKSPAELSNLGKVIVATLRAMMATGLGSDVEGDYRDLIERKPTNAETPFMCILDEYGYYAVEGFAVVPAQARSLGFSAIFAGQDLPAFQKTSKEEAMSIGANTNIKIAMKIEDPSETWEFFMKTAGEAYVTKVDHFQTLPQSITNTYLDTRSSSYEKRSRIDLLDLKDQGLGEAHIFFKSKIVRARTFYANPPAVKRMRLNKMLKIDAPDDRTLIKLEQRIGRFQKVVKNDDLFVNTPELSSDLALVVETYAQGGEMSNIEKGVSALLAYQSHNEAQRPEVPEVLESLQELNVFTPMRTAEFPMVDVMTNDIDAFSQPLLQTAPTLEQIEFVERLSGRVERMAGNVATEIIKDMQLATHYPPAVLNLPSPKELTNTVRSLNSHIITVIENKKREQGGQDSV